MNLIWVPRSEWGSLASTERWIANRRSNPASGKTEIQIHHTAATDTDDSTPNRWDYDEARAYVRKLQWSRPDLGPLPYSENIAVAEDLETVWVFEGRGILKQGAHTGGHNVSGVGWGVLGNFDKPDPQAAALAVAAIETQARRYRDTIVPNLGTVPNPQGWVAWGHRDTSTKTCPGHSLYPLLENFSLEGGDMAILTDEQQQQLALFLAMIEEKGSSVHFVKQAIDDIREKNAAGNAYAPLDHDHGEPTGLQRGDQVTLA